MNKVYLLSDLFANEVVGGAEICNEAIYNYIKNKNILIEKKRTSDISEEFLSLNKDSFFLIANFMLLSEKAKQFFIKNLQNKYIIIEHDHKYTSNNNPSIFNNFIVPEELIINKNFYKNAKAVLAQSYLHSEILSKNLYLDNLVNLAGNVWTKEQIQILKNNINNEKNIEYGVFYSKNKNKGMNAAVEYCNKNNIKFEFIPLQEYDKFINNLSKVKKLVFFPQWVETFSRVSVEAKILGCKIITNNLIGASSEPFFKDTPEQIIKYIEDASNRIPQLILNIFFDNTVNFFSKKQLPKISIITSIFKADKYIKNYLEGITQQTIFKDCELIFVDGNSPENEKQIILQYQNKFNNIKYIRLDKDPGIYGCWNIGIKNSTGEFICNSNVDDLRSIDNLEILRKHLYYNENIELVYGDACEVNEIPNINSRYPLKLYEHSINNFSKENMIKCLPGALPLWRKSMHDKYGFFDEKYSSAGDWEMWLRSVSNGAMFKKINTISGYYYHNPNGKSTSKEFAKQKFLEEKEIFFKYKDLFGHNYDLYLNYFSRNI